MIQDVLEASRIQFMAQLKDAGFSATRSNDELLSGEVAGHKVLIELPLGFPFVKPRVLPESITHARHQELNGALCLFPDDSSDSWMPFFEADVLLEKVASWFEAFEDGFPSGGVSEPLDAHLYYESTQKLGVYGDDFVLPEGSRLGSFGLWTLNDHASLASGLSSSLAATPQVSPTLKERLTPRGRPTPGVWTATSKEPAIATNLGALLDGVEASGGATKGDLLTAIQAKVGAKPRSPVLLLIGIAFPGVESDNQWLFLQCRIPRNWRHNLEAISLKAYAPAPAGRTQMAARVGLTPLTGKRCVLFGCGALGSLVAVGLAREGVAGFVLVDGDRLRPGNLIRHECGLTQVGMLKTGALKERIQQIAPFSAIQEVQRTWDTGELASLLRDADFAVCATGSPAFEMLIDSLAADLGTPAMYMGAYNNAGLGRINLIRPGIDPCLQCVSRLTQENSYPRLPSDQEIVIREVGCNDFTTVARPVDLSAIASEAVRMASALLEPGGINLSDVINRDFNVAHFTNPDRVVRQRFEPLRACQACGSRQAIAS